MPSSVNRVSKHFADKPSSKYVCPTCKKGSLVPENDSFSFIEPPFSRSMHRHDDWDPHITEYRFRFTCVCDRDSCGEIAYVSGSGGVDQRYGVDEDAEYYDEFQIMAFYPAPYLMSIPTDAPKKVRLLLERSFALYWIDVSAAANALRSSLEALLDTLNVPDTQKNDSGETIDLNLHRRIEIWSQKQSEFAELCFALKEVGNVGSHNENVREQHYYGALEIYSHVLFQLFDNNAEKMNKLAKKIRAELKGRKPTSKAP